MDEEAAIGWCEGCSKALFDEDRYHNGYEVLLCEACAPTYEDMLTEPASFRDLDTDEPMTAVKAASLVKAHIAAGGKLTDKMV